MELKDTSGTHRQLALVIETENARLTCQELI